MAFVQSLRVDLPARFKLVSFCNYGKYCAEKNLQQCYYVLGISEDSEPDKIKHAFIKLAKKYHPDTYSEDADPNKFQEIEKAFRILMNKKCRGGDCKGIEEIMVDEIKENEYDIKHNAPQHRHYLSYEGMGYGTIFEREKQFSKVRAVNAATNVVNHRIQKAIAGEKSLVKAENVTHKIKTRYAFDRIIEDLIQEAMKKGEFNNLKGAGKPLDYSRDLNPYVDFVTHKLNQVLIDNGFTPEWIMLQKEIREEKKQLLRNLYNERATFGEYPLKEVFDQFKWKQTVEKYENDTESVNNKIKKYNLLVPTLQTQKLLFDLKKEAQKILEMGQTNKDIAEMHNVPKVKEEKPKTVFSILENLLSRNY